MNAVCVEIHESLQTVQQLVSLNLKTRLTHTEYEQSFATIFYPQHSSTGYYSSSVRVVPRKVLERATVKKHTASIAALSTFLATRGAHAGSKPSRGVHLMGGRI